MNYSSMCRSRAPVPALDTSCARRVSKRGRTNRERQTANGWHRTAPCATRISLTLAYHTWSRVSSLQHGRSAQLTALRSGMSHPHLNSRHRPFQPAAVNRSNRRHRVRSRGTWKQSAQPFANWSNNESECLNGNALRARTIVSIFSPHHGLSPRGFTKSFVEKLGGRICSTSALPAKDGSFRLCSCFNRFAHKSMSRGGRSRYIWSL